MGTLSEVYIGNLPNNFVDDQLVDILEERDISSYVSATVLPYDVGEKSVYGSVKFESEPLALSAVEALQGSHLHIFKHFLLDAAIMSSSSTLHGRLEGNTIPLNAVRSVFHKFVGKNGVESASCSNLDGILHVYLRAKSPPHAHKVLNKLRTFNLFGKAIQFAFEKDYVSKNFGVYVNNLPPDATFIHFNNFVGNRFDKSTITSVFVPRHEYGELFMIS